MDFQLNEEQLQLKKTVREFAESEIAPHVMKWDEASEFPLATIKELGKLGLLGIVFPAEYGGAGMGYVEYVTAIDELSRVDGSVGIIVAAHTSLGTQPIHLFGSAAQREEWLPRLCAGTMLGAFGLTEPGGGSDAGATRTTARLEDGMWVINGTKAFITNSGTRITGLVTVTAVTDRAGGGWPPCPDRWGKGVPDERTDRPGPPPRPIKADR